MVLGYSIFQKELESKLEKTEKDAKNLEEKLNKDLFLLQSQLENEKVRNLNAPMATKVVCFSRLLKCLRSLYGKQCGPRSDCSYRSSLF